MKVLVIGSTGQPGTELLKTLREAKSDLGELSDVYRNCIVEGASSLNIDISNLIT